ncbi:MAG: alcohol dehydrogenase catalytic domain-containing protein [Deltaproteobacteria bacterium]|nr:alcohol dehydrogenase catalytic domain-containing protein [Deltaproteobacteria bacterium]
MRQAIMTEPGKIKFQEIKSPKKLLPDQVLLEIKKIGVCGSDIHVWHGKHPFTSYPIVQGHEYSGKVIAVGGSVKIVKPGDKATGRPQLVCGECKPCKRGDYNVCENLRVQGFQADGCAQDYFILPEDRVVKLPDNISYVEGAMVEPLAVGAHCSSRVTDLKSKNVVVFGAGMIGNIVSQFVKIKGAAKILVSDIHEYRLLKAKECGIEYVNNVTEEPFEDAVKRVFGDEGFQVAIEAAGAEEPLLNAINYIENGSEIIILGVFDKPAGIHMSYVCEHELVLKGSMMYKHEDYLEAVAFLSRQLINTKPLVTKLFDFEDYEKAYKYIDKEGSESLKIMLNIND